MTKVDKLVNQVKTLTLPELKELMDRLIKDIYDKGSKKLMKVFQKKAFGDEK